MISGIEQDNVYQSLKNANLYAFVICKNDLWDTRFMEVKEEYNND